jgi:predicted metal-dependent phosphoesterase TrpH
MRIDLHLHTTASDGLLEPAALMRAARAAGIGVVSITDHDAVDGLEEARRAAPAARLTLIPGVELSAYWGRVEFHILGYFIDAESDALRGFLRKTREARHRRLHAMLSRLQAMGMAVPMDDVLGRARNGNVGRPHLARALIERGFVTSADEAFDRYLGTDKPAYVPRADVSVGEAIRVIREAGGIAALAHPGLHNRDEAIPGLVREGLEAIEVYHPQHVFGRVARYRRLAGRLNLLVTGGSDFHGAAKGDHAATLGVPSLPESEFDRLWAAAEARGALRGLVRCAS